MNANPKPDFFPFAAALVREQEDTRLAFGRALEAFINFRVGRLEAVAKIDKESPGQPIEAIDRKATEIALKRIDRRVRKLKIDGE